MALVLRNVKGSKLTHSELDGNFLYLDQKIEDNIPNETPLQAASMGWQTKVLTPGLSQTIVSSPFINLNLSANIDVWQSEVLFSGINNPPADIIDGAFGVIKNASNVPIVLKNNYSGILIPLNISNGLDFTLNPNSMVSMVYSKTSNRLNVIASDSASNVLKTPISEVFRISEAEASQPNVFISLKEIPNENEFVNVFINGLYVNSEDVLLDGQNLVIARTNVEYGVKEGMQVTVNYKY